MRGVVYAAAPPPPTDQFPTRQFFSLQLLSHALPHAGSVAQRKPMDVAGDWVLGSHTRSVCSLDRLRFEWLVIRRNEAISSIISSSSVLGVSAFCLLQP